MSNSDWDLLQRLYQEALDLPRHERPAFLDAVCAGRPGLRAQVERLVDAASSDSFLRDLTDRAHRAMDGPTDATAASSLLEEVTRRSERYELLRTVGIGGMGVVGEAFDRVRECRVALKVLFRLHLSAISRFKHEFRRLAGIVHPNLVTLHEFTGGGAGGWLLSMEFVAGTDFLTAMRPPGGGCDFDRLRSSLRQFIAAVQHLHDHGILHRDLKPSNVMVTDADRVVVLDFGLAVDLGEALGPARGFAGTLPYMSPEQAAGAPLGASSDWYGVGVMVYEALTGRRPFEGPLPRILHDKQTRDPPAPSSFIAACPPDLEALCQSWLSRDPLLRPSGPAALAVLGPTPPDIERARRTRSPAAVVGREQELEVLQRLLAAADDSRPRIVRILGPSGIGKTTLIDAR